MYMILWDSRKWGTMFCHYSILERKRKGTFFVVTVVQVEQKPKRRGRNDGNKVFQMCERRNCVHSYKNNFGLSRNARLFIRERVLAFIEERQVIGSCFTCQAVVHTNTKSEPLQPSPLPTAPWSEISVDFHGHVPSGEKLFVIVDEYSRYPWCKKWNQLRQKTQLRDSNQRFLYLDSPIRWSQITDFPSILTILVIIKSATKSATRSLT